MDDELILTIEKCRNNRWVLNSKIRKLDNDKKIITNNNELIKELANNFSSKSIEQEKISNSFDNKNNFQESNNDTNSEIKQFKTKNFSTNKIMSGFLSIKDKKYLNNLKLKQKDYEQNDISNLQISIKNDLISFKQSKNKLIKVFDDQFRQFDKKSKKNNSIQYDNSQNILKNKSLIKEIQDYINDCGLNLSEDQIQNKLTFNKLRIESKNKIKIDELIDNQDQNDFDEKLNCLNQMLFNYINNNSKSIEQIQDQSKQNKDNVNASISQINMNRLINLEEKILNKENISSQNNEIENKIMNTCQMSDITQSDQESQNGKNENFNEELNELF